ncbi:MAG: hypothetical protein COA70_11935 [Planctomycetota bacterium]|nr:MAG: hypothetical protein COA70_11935 [Planctomycetota bacterium]
MIRSIFTCVAAAAIVVSASAQTQQIPAGNLHRTVAPTHGVYNMTTGFEINAQSYRSGPATIFDNTDGVGYYFSTLSGTEEWIDSCAFIADEISGNEQINGFDFSYCSLLIDPVGDAITVEVRFYDDNPGFMEPTGWTNPIAGTIQNAACAYGIAGLPGATGVGISCWAIAIDLQCGFECSVPQEITPGGVTEFNGIGWMYMDALVSGNTGPTLGSTIGPGGPGTAIPGYGSRDLFELMDLAFVGSGWTGTFFFGGAPKTQATFDVVLYGDGILDTDVVNADAPDTGDVLCLGSNIEFRSGNAVTWALDNAGGTAVFPSAAYAMLVGTAGSSAGFGSIAGAGTTLLVDPGSLLFPPTPFIMSGAVPSVTTPPLPGLPPTVWAQSMGFNGGIGAGNAAEASNALRHSN